MIANLGCFVDSLNTYVAAKVKSVLMDLSKEPEETTTRRSHSRDSRFESTLLFTFSSPSSTLLTVVCSPMLGVLTERTRHSSMETSIEYCFASASSPARDRMLFRSSRSSDSDEAVMRFGMGVYEYA